MEWKNRAFSDVSFVVKLIKHLLCLSSSGSIHRFSFMCCLNFRLLHAGAGLVARHGDFRC